MSEPRLPVALGAAALGGVIGSLGRAGLSDWIPAGSGFPWIFFVINVVGSAALAGLGALALTRTKPWVGVFLGTGVLGGFTTMSAASEQTVVLLDRGHTLTGVLYVVGTLVTALVAVRLVRAAAGTPRP